VCRCQPTVAIACAALVAGCAVNSGVVPVGQNSFMVSRQVATGFVNPGNLKPEAVQEAKQFCSDQKKTLVVTNVNGPRPSSGPGDFPRVELQFICWDPTTIDAINSECNEKRVRHEVKGYRGAVECSTPRIVAAWREGRFPYMDLIELYEAARLVGADNVDNGKLSEPEYKLQLAELRSRTTAEAQRRSLAATSAQAAEAQAQAATIQAQAASLQANAAMLQGLSAFQSANRPLPTYNVNVCNAGPGQANTCSYPR
jgi:hypothetical protein